MGRPFSIFDYTVTISRRGNSLLISCPELEIYLGSPYLNLMETSPEILGKQVLQVFERINMKRFQFEKSGKLLPTPLSTRGVQVLSVGSFSIREAAKVMGVSTCTLRKMAKQGLIESYQTPGGHLRFSINALANYDVRDEDSIKKSA